MTDPTRFWNARADRYSRQPIKDPETYERTLERTRKHLCPSDRVLEIGCGTGTTALLLAPSVKEILATDFSARMIEIARSKATEQGIENVRFECAAATGEGAASGDYDAVLAFNLLHLLDDVAGAVRALHARLRPGGLFISKTVCIGERSVLFVPLLGALRFLRLAPYVRRLRFTELEQIIATAGFELVESESHPTSGSNRFIVARKP